MGNFSNYWDLHTLFTKIKNKIKSVSDKIDDSVSLKTATGNPVTITDAANANAEELSMTIEPIQSGSGDPSPDNVRPISGISEAVVTRTGKNLFTGIFINAGVTNSYNSENGNLTIVSTGAVQPQCTLKLENLQKFAGQSVTFSISGYNLSDSSLKPYIALYKNSSNTLLGNLGNAYEGITHNSITVQLPDDIEHILFLFRMNQAKVTVAEGATLTVSGIQLEFGTTPTAYEPYTATNATISFGQTVYGGSVNFKTGEVTVTHGMVDLGSLTWEVWSTHGFRSYDLNNLIKHPDNSTPLNAISSEAIVLSWAQYFANTDNTLKFAHYKDGDVVFIVGGRNMGYTDATTFTTAMSGVQLCYELATPTTLTLTPAELELLKGNNTITANVAEISLSYYPDNAIGALAGRVDGKADVANATTNGAVGLVNASDGSIHYFGGGASGSSLYVSTSNNYPVIRAQASSSTYSTFGTTGFFHTASNKSIDVDASGISGSGNGSDNFNLTREKLSYLNNITSDVQTQLDRFNNNMLPNNLNAYTNNGVRTIYQSVMAYINGLSGSSKPRGFVQFYITYDANAMPSDLPSNTTPWQYAWGEIYFRNGYIDATILLHPYADDGTMLIKQVIHSEEKTWQTVLTDKSGATKTYVDNKVKKLATQTIQYISTSTDLEYTGVNVSCPTGHTYIVRAKCDWDNGYTQSIAASDSSTDVSTWRRFAYGDSAYITFMLNEGETAYIWGKWSVAGKNRVHLSITDITI